jgi:hypothetical protein
MHFFELFFFGQYYFIGLMKRISFIKAIVDIFVIIFLPICNNFDLFTQRLDNFVYLLLLLMLTLHKIEVNIWIIDLLQNFESLWVAVLHALVV